MQNFHSVFRAKISDNNTHMPKWPPTSFIPARLIPQNNNKAGLEVPHDAAGLLKT